MHGGDRTAAGRRSFVTVGSKKRRKGVETRKSIPPLSPAPSRKKDADKPGRVRRTRSGCRSANPAGGSAGRRSYGRTKALMGLVFGASISFHEANTEDDILALAGSAVESLEPGAIVAVTSRDEKTDDLGIRLIRGLRSRLLPVILKTLGADPLSARIAVQSIHPDDLALFQAGRLVRLAGIHSFAGRTIPKTVCIALEKALRLRAVHTMGFTWRGDHYGGVTLFLRRRASPAHPEFVEAVVRAASSAIQRKRAENRLQESEERYRALVEASPDAITVSNQDGRIDFTNARAARLHGFAGPRSLLGTNVYDLIAPGDRERAAANAKKAVETGAAQHGEFLLVRKNGSAFSGELTVGAFRNSAGKPGAVISVTRDISERRQLQEALAGNAEAQRHFSNRLTLILSALGELSRTGSFDELSRRSVELAIERLGFDRVGLWFLSADQKTIQGSYGTDEAGLLRDERHLRLSIDRYAARQVLALDRQSLVLENAPLHGVDVKVVDYGNHIVSKLWDGVHTIGFLSVDNLNSKRPIRREDQEILDLYAATLASLFTLKKAEEALRTSDEDQRLFSERLAALLVAVNGLSSATTFDDLCRGAVEIVRKQIGADRAGIWFFSADRRMLEGSFGTDEHGRIRDERGQRVPIKEEIHPLLRDRRPALIMDMESLQNERGESVGRGEHASASLWNGEEAVGILAADNLIHHRPFSEQDQRLLGLFSVSLGHLCTLLRAEDSLRDSENRFRVLFEQVAVGVAQVDSQDGKFTKVNEKFCDIVGYTPRELSSLKFHDFTHPDDIPDDLDHMRRLAGGEIIDYSIDKRLIHKNGSPVWVNQTVSNLWFSKDRKNFTIVVIQDITPRKRMEDQIKADIREKNLLLKEVHHRVKNNMQVIVSLLSLQAAQIEDPDVLDKFRVSQDRILSMALVHEMLYGSEDLSSIDFRHYIESLTGTLFRSFGVDSGAIGLDLDLEPIRLGIDDAVPCGLILQELVSNALKYAFPEGWKPKPRIRIEFRRADDGLRLTVADNGRGMPETTDLDRKKTLGFKLVHILGREQLEGTVEVKRENGTQVTLMFREGKK
jgi:PAS domain S-box-containing protein